MRLASGKFKHLAIISPLLRPGAVPPYKILSEFEDLPDLIAESHILRSSLRNEASPNCLLSGKSLSLGGIDSRQKLLAAWEKVLKQSNLDEVILQAEIFWERHLTVVFEEELLFTEIKTPQGEGEFFYWTPLAQSLDPIIEKLKDFLLPLRSYLGKGQYWLMELGLKQGELYLFQVHPVDLNLLDTIFSSDLVAQIVSTRLRFSHSQSLWQLLRVEWRASRFRSKMDSKRHHPTHVFLNWEYLFHYFRVFCMLKKWQPSAENFASFLNETYSSSWPGNLVKKHLEFANQLRKSEEYSPMDLGFKEQGVLFLGKGQVNGVVGKEIVFAPKIDLSLVYQKDKPLVILSAEVGILSHPVLASVENGIYLVLGLKENLQEGDKIFLDFEQKHLKVN